MGKDGFIALKYSVCPVGCCRKTAALSKKGGRGGDGGRTVWVGVGGWDGLESHSDSYKGN